MVGAAMANWHFEIAVETQLSDCKISQECGLVWFGLSSVELSGGELR